MPCAACFNAIEKWCQPSSPFFFFDTKNYLLTKQISVCVYNYYKS